MRITRLVATALAGVLVATLPAGAADARPPRQNHDPNSVAALYRTLTEETDRAYLQVLGRVDGQDMVYRISGSTYTQVPGNLHGSALAHGKELFGIEGYNIRKLYRVPNTNDVLLLTREIVFYTDPATGEILREWTNPLDGKTRPVVPIANDHVNQKFRIKDGNLFAVYGPQEIPIDTNPTQVHDELVWTSDVAPLYSLQQRYNIPENFGLINDQYASWEMFDFYTDEFESWIRSSTTYPPSGAMEVKNSWTRMSPWTPFMCLAENTVDGGLVYHARSWTQQGYHEVDDWIRSEVDANYPIYRTAPTEVDPKPNATSWTSFYYSQLAPTGITWQQWCDQ